MASREYYLAWDRANKEKRQDRQRAEYKKLKLELVAAYGGKCSCCGESEIRVLTLEHLNHDGNEHRAKFGGASDKVYRDLKRRGWPQEGYTVLCWNCNQATKFGEDCYHKRI